MGKVDYQDVVSGQESYLKELADSLTHQHIVKLSFCTGCSHDIAR